MNLESSSPMGRGARRNPRPSKAGCCHSRAASAVARRHTSAKRRTCAAVGRLVGSLTRHLATSSRIALLKCFLLVSAAPPQAQGEDQPNQVSPSVKGGW